MNTHIFSIQKMALAVVVVAVSFFAFASLASAATYYYPTSTNVPYYPQYQPVYQYQYQSQPVYQYQYQVQNRTQMLAQLQNLIAQLERLQNQYRLMYGNSYFGGGSGSGYRYSNDYDIDVDTLYARDVNDDEATLYGEVDLDDAPYADVWFEYGEGGDLDEETDEERIDRNDNDRFSIDVDGLDEDDRYYFRAVAEDPNGDRVYGKIESFEADGKSSSDDDKPDVETGDADDVTDDSAEIRGEVDMNDFDNGDVFFVWGEDEDQVEDVEDEDQYSDIDEDGDDLQKYKVYNDLDGERTFWFEIFGLDDNTDHYYRICVEYEDEDDDDTLECGDVENFETD